MSVSLWKLIDVDADLFEESLVLGAGELGTAAAKCRVSLRTLRGGLRDGLQVLEVDNGVLKFAVLPGRGMGLWRAWHGKDEIGWRSPVKGPVHPRYVNVAEPSGLGWLDGFDELLVRCGLSSFGAPDHTPQGKLLWPLHGRIANLPVHRLEVTVDDASGEISVTGIVDETRFHFQKLRLTSTIRTRPGEPGVRIHDVVENLSGNEGQMQLLYHVNVGEPLLEPGSQVVVPAAEVSPRDAVAASGVQSWDTYGPPTAGSPESAFFFTLRGDQNGQTHVMLKNPRGDRGFGLRFDVLQMPCFTIWKNTPAQSDGYVTGLEPGTSYPNTRTHEESQKRVVTLPPGGKVEFDVELQYYPTAAAVASAEEAVAAITRLGSAPTVHEKPKPGWTMG